MAKKGQKFNSYIFDVKEMVLDEYKEKHNIKYLSEKYNIPSGTIKTWTSKLNHPEKYIGQGQKRGRKKEANLFSFFIIIFGIKLIIIKRNFLAIYYRFIHSIRSTDKI